MIKKQKKKNLQNIECRLAICTHENKIHTKENVAFQGWSDLKQKENKESLQLNFGNKPDIFKDKKEDKMMCSRNYFIIYQV